MSTATETNPSISGFDAAADGSGRSMLIFPTNSRQEMGRWTRRKLQEKARGLEGNFTPATRIKKKFARHVAGKGIFPQPITNDPEWNALNKARFERFASNRKIYSVDASRDFWKDQRIAAGELGGGDGEYFAAFVEMNGMLAIQPLDPFEIESGYGTTAKIYEDGVRVDPYLRPLGYAVRELQSVGNYTISRGSDVREIGAENMIHLFDRRRAKQLRGIPPIYSGLNDGHDALDFLALEKASAKLHALLAVAKTTAAQNRGGGVTGAALRQLDTAGNLVKIEEKYKGGGLAIDLGPDEKLELLASSRPGPHVLEAVKFYCHLLALGTDLPYSVLFGFAGVGGTAVRADMEDAQGTFEILQDELVWTHSQPIYVRDTARAMATGQLRMCKDPYWWACDWHGPAKLTVDYGRSSDANIALVKNGMMSLSRYYEERGQDARAEIEKQIQLRKWAKQRCAEEGVEETVIFEPTPGAVTNVKVNQPAQE